MIRTHAGVGIDVARARQVLDEDHFGLEKIKERILEYLAVKKLREERKVVERTREPILCLVGPPGVGKTSLGQSPAGKKLVRLSHHGYTLGDILRRPPYVRRRAQSDCQALRRPAHCMLDEIDKSAPI